MAPFEGLRSRKAIKNHAIADTKTMVSKAPHHLQTHKRITRSSKASLLLASDVFLVEPTPTTPKPSRLSILTLPGEIRNKIWKLSVTGFKITIVDQEPYTAGTIQIIKAAHPDDDFPRKYTQPSFTLPLVCRQMHAETSSFIYSSNTFKFEDGDEMERWINARTPSQRGLITSLDVPMGYMQNYDYREFNNFSVICPSIERIDVDVYFLYFTRFVTESIWTAQVRIEGRIRQREGRPDLVIEWH